MVRIAFTILQWSLCLLSALSRRASSYSCLVQVVQRLLLQLDTLYIEVSITNLLLCFRKMFWLLWSLYEQYWPGGRCWSSAVLMSFCISSYRGSSTLLVRESLMEWLGKYNSWLGYNKIKRYVVSILFFI